MKKCVWPLNSPDLHVIGDYSGPNKSLLRLKLLQIKRASNKSPQKCKMDNEISIKISRVIQTCSKCM